MSLIGHVARIFWPGSERTTSQNLTVFSHVSLRS